MRATMDIDFADMLMEVVSRRASDLHISVGAHPTVRVRGRLSNDAGTPMTARDLPLADFHTLRAIARRAERTAAPGTQPIQSACV